MVTVVTRTIIAVENFAPGYFKTICNIEKGLKVLYIHTILLVDVTWTCTALHCTVLPVVTFVTNVAWTDDTMAVVICFKFVC